MNRNKTSIGIIKTKLLAAIFVVVASIVILAPSCRSGSPKVVSQIRDESKDSFTNLANALIDSSSTFDDVYEKAVRFYDIAIKMSQDKESKPNRLLAQILTSNTLWDILEKGRSDETNRVGILIEKAGIIANQWIYDELEDGYHLFHDNYFMSYKETDYESDDSFTIDILFPRKESEGYIVALDLPESATYPLDLMFTKEIEEREDIDNVILEKWKKVIPKDKDFSQITVLSDNGLLDLMLEYDYMYFFFETEKKTAKGECVDSGRISLAPFKDVYYSIIDKR